MENNKCKVCGSVLGIGATTCPYCGNATGEVKKASFGWAVLGFFFPFIGLILFIVWNKSDKGKAKKAGIGALVGFLSTFVLYILFFFVFWSSFQKSVIDQTCKTYGEDFRAVKIENNSTYCDGSDECWVCCSSDVFNEYSCIGVE